MRQAPPRSPVSESCLTQLEPRDGRSGVGCPLAAPEGWRSLPSAARGVYLRLVPGRCVASTACAGRRGTRQSRSQNGRSISWRLGPTGKASTVPSAPGSWRGCSSALVPGTRRGPRARVRNGGESRASANLAVLLGWREGLAPGARGEPVLRSSREPSLLCLFGYPFCPRVRLGSWLHSPYDDLASRGRSSLRAPSHGVGAANHRDVATDCGDVWTPRSSAARRESCSVELAPACITGVGRGIDVRADPSAAGAQRVWSAVG
jgi:hypothetical protein